MSQADLILKQLLSGDTQEKVAASTEESTPVKRDYLKLAEELEKTSDKPTEKTAEAKLEFNDIEKVAYKQVQYDALLEALSRFGGNYE